ncbi:MAG TPA: AraC family transcriptional regulator [Roseiarcus sp.]
MSTPTLTEERHRFAPLILSSDSFKERDRFDAWREELMLRVIRVDVDVPDRSTFRTRLRVLTLPNLAIIERRSTPSVVKRTHDLVRDGDDALVLTLPWGKNIDVRAGADEARVGPGEAIITSLGEVGSLRTPAGVRGLSLRVDRKVALNFAPAAERLVNRPIKLDEAAFAILSSYVVSLMSAPRGLPLSLARLADHQVRELLAHVFDPAGDLARAQVYGGIKAARLRAVVGDIDRRLADPGLNAAAVGRRLHLSERYVQQLLEGAGESFSLYVREMRLRRARQLLGDSLTAHLRIADIAAMAGFNDLSHFNRMFRSYFGETPSDARRAR